MFVYVLRCRGGRYYVGVTACPDERFSRHWRGAGSAWTRRFPPVAVVLVEACSSPAAAKTRERELLDEFTRVYGRDYVRGAGRTACDVSQEAASASV